MPTGLPPIPGETELDRLVARSRLFGADPTLVLFGGGNTSSKILERDHLGNERWVLRIKGTGSDLRTIEARHFAGLWLDDLQPLRERDTLTDEEMLAYLSRCLVEADAPRPSIETLLHGFLPALHVDHVHADAICALANAPDPIAAVREALGDDIAVAPYVRPGFALAKVVAEFADSRAVVLAHHGLVTWSDTHEESYRLTLELVAKAQDYLEAHGSDIFEVALGSGPAPEQFLAQLRGRLSRERRQVLGVDPSQRAVAGRSDVDVVAAVRSTPDHMLRIGPRTAVIEADGDIDAQVTAYEEDYRAYHDAEAVEGTPMQSALPKVMLVPNVGGIAAGPDAGTARLRLELAAHTHAATAATLDSFGGSSWLTPAQVWEFEYWPLELYKLTFAPPPAELAGTVVLVTGAASGIGRDVAVDLARRGAHLAIADLNAEGLAETLALLPPGRAVAVDGDLTDRVVVDGLVSAAVEAWGGVDAVVFNAGIAATGNLVDVDEAEWRHSLEVNLTSHFTLTKRVWSILEHQGIGASLVYISSKNAFAPGAGFGPYSVAKAGLVQLAKIAALEGGKHGIRANVVNPDAIFAGSKLWSDELRKERADAHGVAISELEAFYAKRSLLGRAVTGPDVAEAVAFLVSDRSRTTTGCVLTVDGGVPAAFPR